jgi:hypothetical protein
MSRRKVISTPDQQRETRRKIAAATIQERMGLDEEWLDPDAPIQIPTELPEFPGQNLTSHDREDLQRHLRLLEDGGCHRGVLNWCLARLGEREIKPRPDSKARVSESGSSKAILHKPLVLPKLATREDMQEVANGARSMMTTISKYRDELMLAADALEEECPLPEGILTEAAFDPSESINVLQASLCWVRDLAERWLTPSQTTLMKSKAVLYLLTYVSIRASAVANPVEQKSAGARLQGAGGDFPRLRHRQASTITGMIGIYCEMEIEPSDLIAKLAGFRRDHPDLLRKLVSLLTYVEATAHRETS